MKIDSTEDFMDYSEFVSQALGWAKDHFPNLAFKVISTQNDFEKCGYMLLKVDKYILTVYLPTDCVENFEFIIGE